MVMVRYWRAHGSPATLKTLPRGEVRIQDSGAESFNIGGKQVQLRKVSISGLISGSETPWLDAQDRRKHSQIETPRPRHRTRPYHFPTSTRASRPCAHR